MVLSDKKEALDVVEDKITETMNRVRLDKKFQNPILRLGKSGNNYQKILSQSSLNNIKTHYRAVKKDNENLKNEIEKSRNSIKDDLASEIISYNNIDINEIAELVELERFYETIKTPFDFEEILKVQDAAIRLNDLKKILSILQPFTGDGESESDFLNMFALENEESRDFQSLRDTLQFLNTISELKEETKNRFPETKELFERLKPVFEFELEKIKHLYEKYLALKKPLVGYMFNKKKTNKLNREFLEIVPASNYNEPHKCLNEISKIISICNFILSKKGNIERKCDFLKVVMTTFTIEDGGKTIKSLASKIKILDLLDLEIKLFPSSTEMCGLTSKKLSSIANNKIADMSESDYNRLIRFVDLKQKLYKNFDSVPDINFSRQRNVLEDLVTTQMTLALDSRVIDFYENNKNTAASLRKNIQSQQRFPKEDFIKLKEAFPCILASIRDYAEYIPLKAEIFDLIIIDEASQVSIAQAFPALLRAKKILILGDRKQFSNVKASHARSDTNIEYLNRLKDRFKQLISNDPSKMSKLDKFNIKTSILDFFEFISNFSTQLTKHFRGYKELISYSNINFYKNSLQVMKIRGKPIDHVIKFTVIDHDGKIDLVSNSNQPEIDFIINELLKLKESGKKLSVGIITPHTNQQKLIIDNVHRLPEKDYFIDDLNLKIMTFDTCQGEERDLIFYSMVATQSSDHLWGVFPKTLSPETEDETESIRKQRLNVGFSRAKECIHFILSMPIDNYNGAIGAALRHYSQLLAIGKKEHGPNDVDQNSIMEKEVLNWFYQTKFYLDHNTNIEFFPQFELGKYLKQLDKTYNHPNYRVDFLIFYNDGKTEHKIIVEYDGFKEHFIDLASVNKLNYEQYYSEDDVYRQKIIESYGYKFLRINKFNSGDNPVKRLNARLIALIEENTAFQSPFISNYLNRIEALQNGEMKECLSCRIIKTKEEFKDNLLITGYGRVCCECKKKSRSSHSGATAVDFRNKNEQNVCPRCNNSMVLRSGKYGKFYGCSKYPYCRGTRPYHQEK